MMSFFNCIVEYMKKVVVYQWRKNIILMDVG